MSTAVKNDVIAKRVTNEDIAKTGMNAAEIVASASNITNPQSELEILKAKLAATEAALFKATHKQPAFSSVRYLFSLLPYKINKEGVLPELDKAEVEILQAKVLAKQKELGIEKEYKLISVNTDYRFFSMVLDAIQPVFQLVPRTTPFIKAEDKSVEKVAK